MTVNGKLKKSAQESQRYYYEIKNEIQHSYKNA